MQKVRPSGSSAKLPEVGLSADTLQILSRLLTVLGISPEPVESRPVPATLSSQEAKVLVDALLDRLYRRVPLAANRDKGIEAEHCPFSGLNRGQFYELFDRVEDGEPVIKSVSLRHEGEAHGARFYNVGSVLRYLDGLAVEQARKATG